MPRQEKIERGVTFALIAIGSIGELDHDRKTFSESPLEIP